MYSWETKGGVVQIILSLYIFWRARGCWLGHSFSYVARFLFFKNVWIRTPRAAVASRRATNLASHLPGLATHLPNLATHLLNSATHLPDLANHP